MKKEEYMNVVVSVNDGFLFPMCVMLYSLARNTRRYLRIYLMYCDLSEKGRKRIQDFVSEKCHGELIHVKVDENAFREHDASTSMFSTETFYRLFIPYLLPPNVERALWLDADMIIQGNIDDFYDSSFGEDGHAMLVAAWNDKDRKKLKQYKDRLGKALKTDSYFNSGVMLFHLPEIRERISMEEIKDFWLQNQKILTFLDQDIVNCLMGPFTVLKDATIYNNQAHADEDAREQLKMAKIIHYVAYRKPWKLYYDGSGDDYFWKYASECGFRLRTLEFKLLHGPVLLIYTIYKLVRYGNNKK